MGKYVITEEDGVGNYPVGHRIRQFKLRFPDQADWQSVGVTWHEDIRRPFCSHCSSVLAAESSSCTHARALSRHMNKVEPKPEP